MEVVLSPDCYPTHSSFVLIDKVSHSNNNVHTYFGRDVDFNEGNPSPVLIQPYNALI